MPDLVQKIEDAIDRHQLIRRGAKVYVGFSGGPDSVVLTDCLRKIGYQPSLLHVNFGLRPEANEEAAWVAKWAEDRGLSCEVFGEDAAAYAEKHKVSIQVAAREIRYRHFEETVGTAEQAVLALGHHRDDHLETLLMSLFRGKSNELMLGIPRKRGHFVRPMLDIPKAEILAFAQKHALEYLTDSSNSSPKYMRNAVRNELVPILEKLNPSWAEQLMEREQWYRKGNEFLKHELGERSAPYIEALPEWGNSVWKINLPDLKSALGTHTEMALAFFLEGLKIKFPHRAQILQLLSSQSGRSVQLDGWNWVLDHGFLIGMPVESRLNTFEFPDEILFHTSDVGKTQQFGELNVRLEIRESWNSASVSEQTVEYGMNLNAIKWPIRCRGWRKDDVMIPLGMTGKKKLKAIVRDQKWTLFEKAEALVLEDEAGIILLNGFRISERVKSTENEQKHLVVTVKKPNSVSEGEN